MTTTALSVRPSSELTAWDRVNDPLDFVDKMGSTFWKAGVGGARTEAEGKVLALACLTEKQTPFEITRRHHIMDGKLSLKADVMLAEFNTAGGHHAWIKTGDEGESAELELTHPNGQKLVSSFSLADAKEQGLVKAGGPWTKGKKSIGQMLRARCTSRGIRMLMPQIVAGSYTPEEIEDFAEEKPQEEKRARRTKAEIEARREELQAGAASSTATAPAGDPIIDATPEPVTSPAAKESEQPPFTVPERPATAADPEPAPGASPAMKPAADPVREVLAEADLSRVHSEIMQAIKDMGATIDQLNDSLKNKNPAWSSLDKVTRIEDATKIRDHLRAALAKSKK